MPYAQGMQLSHDLACTCLGYCTNAGLRVCSYNIKSLLKYTSLVVSLRIAGMLTRHCSLMMRFPNL